MDIHKPKPVHSWRELLGEIGVIVIGVLIALGAEQVVETLHWREKASQAREALREEALENYNLSAERVVLAPCLDAQLDRLKARVLAAGTRLVPMTPIKSGIGLTIYRHPSRLWTDAAWQSTVTEQVSSHLTADERRSLATLYSSIGIIRQLNREELAADGQLMILATPLPLDASLRAHLIETIESERIRTNSMRLIAQQQMEIVRAIFPDVAKTADSSWLSKRDDDNGTYAWCRANGLPMGESLKARSGLIVR